MTRVSSGGNRDDWPPEPLSSRETRRCQVHFRGWCFSVLQSTVACESPCHKGLSASIGVHLRLHLLCVLGGLCGKTSSWPEKECLYRRNSVDGPRLRLYDIY
jgi:hypothetical protein